MGLNAFTAAKSSLYIMLLKHKNCLARTNAMHHHRESTPFDKTNRAHDSQIVKENLKLGHGGPI